MTLRRVRPGLYVAGAVLAVGCLVGARALTAGNGSADGPKTAAPPPGNGKVGGPVVLGTVDSDPPPVSYGLPPVVQSGTVAKVLVKDGQEVKAGDELYVFDTAVQARQLEKAAAAVVVAQTKVAEAEEGAKRHAREVEVMRQTVAGAEKKKTWYADQYNLIKENLERSFRTDPKFSEPELAALLRRNADLHKANVEWGAAGVEVDLLRSKLAVLEASNPGVLVKVAEAGVKLAEAEQAVAQTAVDLCTVRAKTAGTVEQVKVSPGSTLGISTRDPALWVIPAGPRVVRAEVEADFAHRVTDDIKGREVTVYDHTDPKLTYKGKVLRVSGTFLPKRAEGLIPSDTRVLEAVVEVADPAPAGRPPLRVGQRVRVNLGQ